jgi:hypothetical protein
MHKQYTSDLDPNGRLDFAHYKQLWRRSMIDTTSTNLRDRLSYTGVVASPHGFDLSTLSSSNLERFVHTAEKNSVMFVNNYNTFFADSFLTFTQLTTIARWRHALDNLNNSPLHAVKYEPHKEEDFLLVWMFKHNMKYTIIDRSF